MNTRKLFNEGWLFSKSPSNADSYSFLDFSPVEVPHDWLIFNTQDLYENSIGWYKKSFTWNKNEERVLLQFDGVYMDSTLFVNDNYIGEWKYGYSSFEFDITSALNDGNNEIILKVVHKSPNSRWYSGAGIYRNVWLQTRSENYVETDGIYVSTSTADHSNWQVDIETEVVVNTPIKLIHRLEKDGIEIATVSSQMDTSKMDSQILSINNPLLWDVDHPHLYDLVTEVWSDELVEQITTFVGFRTVVLSPTDGMLVNGERKKIQGVCEHHDLGALGAAFNPVALRKRLDMLKKMGVNGIRTAHNMPAKELMSFADEMGFYVVSEGFDMWERSKTRFDYARFFNEWAHTDVKSWVKRDRNHPSLIMWSIGNEIYDTHANERGQEITRQLTQYVLEFDPKQNALVTIGSNYMPWENAQKCADIVKIAGYNYGEKYYQEHHEKYPNWVIYGSETASVVQSRGIYHFPYEHSILSDDDLQCSALGNSTTSWGARSAESCVIAERNTDFSLGQFIWTGFDYIGEPTPYHTKNSYFGQIDTAMFPKDSFYIYQASWSDYRTNPMIHLFPYWDFNPGQIIDVRVATNAPQITLHLNGKCIAERKIDHEFGKELVPTIKVPYESGELTAIAYDLEGNIIAKNTLYSFTDPKKLALIADKDCLYAGTSDLIFVEINALDENNHPVANATNRIQVSVSGAGRLVGLDNGDSTDYDQYKGISRRLFSGKLMAIIAATGRTGNINVTAFSEGLGSQTLTLKAIGGNEIFTDDHFYPKNETRKIQSGTEEEIPLRKIELIAKNGHALSPELQIVEIKAKLYPSNATYQDIEWSIVTDGGVPTNIASIESSKNSARIMANGAGHFRIRCTSRNGKDHISLISELEMQATGLGAAHKDPYDFIAGSLFDDHFGEIGSGNERGIATNRESKSYVGYHQIDFGKYGSDTIDLPIFALSDAPHTVQIWEGKPEDGASTLVADVIYQKQPIWDVYQPATYQLSKKLVGICSLYFVFSDCVHLKGFSFVKTQRAFQKNRVLDADSMYGDTFKKTERAVEDIGNNVSFVFEDLDFGESDISKLVICGHSPIDKNTIHVRYNSGEKQINQLIEFEKSASFEERSFDLEKVSGIQTIHFVFLPGSNFNFEWFKFE